MFLGRGKPEELPPSILCSAQLQLRWNDSSVGMLSTQLIGRDAISIVAPEARNYFGATKDPGIKSIFFT
ncbi:hypothetical protein D5086_032332 [Populus alba]|uniref:Uncharacterized protein n=1 Tax=Populus alba TaxID=43335 RepID=A0ACC4AM00_POPAL